MRFLPCLQADVVRDQLHRARPVQRHQRDHVLEARRRRLLEQVAHAARFKLEHPGGVARGEHRVGRLVVQRQRLDGKILLAQFAHVALRPVEHGERGEAEEVELHQADRLDVVLVELRDDVGGALGRVQRAEVGELARRDQHAARVHADVAREALELLGEFQQVAHLFLLLLALREQRLHLARVLQRDVLARLHRHQLRDLVAEVVAEVEHAAGVAQHRARRHGAEGGDLRHRILAVLLAHVVDHAVAAVLAEVDVEVGHRHALRD